MGTHPIFESDFDCLTEMLSIGNRWRNVLKDLSFVDASCVEERKKIISEIWILSKAPIHEFEPMICAEFEEVAKQLRLAIAATKRDPETLSYVFDIANLCEQLGRHLYGQPILFS